MKIYPFLLYILLFLIISCSQKGIELKYKFTPGTKKQYKLISNILTTAKTENSIKTYTSKAEIIINWLVKDTTNNGNGKIKITYDKIRYVNTNCPEKCEAIIKRLKDTQIDLVLSNTGHIISIKGLENFPDQNITDFNVVKIMVKSHPIFPRSPIKIGKSWDRQQKFPIKNGIIEGSNLVYKRFSVNDTSNNNAAIDSEISIRFNIPNNDKFSIKNQKNTKQGLYGKGKIIFNTKNGTLENVKAGIFGGFNIHLKNPVTNSVSQTKFDISQNIKIKAL